MQHPDFLRNHIVCCLKYSHNSELIPLCKQRGAYSSRLFSFHSSCCSTFLPWVSVLSCEALWHPFRKDLLKWSFQVYEEFFMKLSSQTEESLSFHLSTSVALSVVLLMCQFLLFSFSKPSSLLSLFLDNTPSQPPYFKWKQWAFVPCPHYICLHSIYFLYFVCMCFLCSCFWNHGLLPSPPHYRGALVTSDTTYYHCFFNPVSIDIGLKWEQHPRNPKIFCFVLFMVRCK